ncbi:MAG: thioredoxin [Deltaproteobacteria bacterium]|jgi:thioredoxin 1|nr:thioredoxin [Deltaproteobacteria bacterium]
MSENIKELTDDIFDETLSSSTLPVLVDFWAPWCGPCRALAPVLGELSNELSDKLFFVKVNVDENQNAPSKYNVRTIPCLIVFKNGEEVGRVVNAHKGKQILLAELEKML